MIWPHDLRFPQRKRVLLIACAAGVVGAFCWTGQSWGERLLTVVLSAYGLCSGFLFYGLFLFLTRPVPALNRILAFLVFYGSMLSGVAWLMQFAYETATAGTGTGFQAATSFTLNVTSTCGAAAAAFNAIERARGTPEHASSRPEAEI